MEKLSYTISGEKFLNRQKIIWKKIIVIAIPLGISAALGLYFTGGIWYALGFVFVLVIFIWTIIFFTKKNFIYGQTVDISPDGLKVTRGMKTEFYNWSEFDHYTTAEAWAKVNEPVPGIVSPGFQGFIKDVQNSTKTSHGTIYLLRWRRQSLKKTMPHLTLYTNPDTAEQVEEFLKKYIKK